ncbi:MAG TPA: MotA/TolQ/ExbB proton channel family protein [Bacteroidales bacterium]|nr:MotA/TolQ/ExbB proton channel family protein [Bacteroidales bacterium]
MQQILLVTSGGINSYFDVMMKGGVIMIPIVLLSVISFYIFIIKIITIRRDSKGAEGFSYRLLKVYNQDGRENAVQYCEVANTSMGRIFANGLARLNRSNKEAEDMMESTANVEIAHMEKDLNYLGVIAGVAPLLGFIGTIAGVIKIFYGIALADNISIGIIAGGLYQKMVSSGTGLIVGVIAYSFYHYLHIKVDKFAATLQEESLMFFKSI